MQRILQFDQIKLYAKHILIGWRRCYTTETLDIYRKCFAVLGVPDASCQDTVREAYINLVKIYHPDSGHTEADKDRFFEIDTAFRILQKKFAKNRRGIDDDEHEVSEKNFDIRHTAPQHRQYLSYGGVGYGTIFQRERQYQRRKVVKAQQRVMDHRLEQARAEEDAVIPQGYYKKHAVKTKHGIDRIVEDLILEAMSKGEFTNLTGTGKPLPLYQQQNPYIDFMTHKLNKILLDGGFTPEWITLQKEIRSDIDKLKQDLNGERKFLGSLPLSDAELTKWNAIYSKYEKDAQLLNKKIDNFNLIVPILHQQIFRIEYDKMACMILETGEYGQCRNDTTCGSGVGENMRTNRTIQNENLFSLVSSLFTKN